MRETNTMPHKDKIALQGSGTKNGIEDSVGKESNVSTDISPDKVPSGGNQQINNDDISPEGLL